VGAVTLAFFSDRELRLAPPFGPVNRPTSAERVAVSGVRVGAGREAIQLLHGADGLISITGGRETYSTLPPVIPAILQNA
jgi:hypothetical protein